MVIVMQNVFEVIDMVLEVITITVIMILLLKLNYHDSFC
jgi:hypothetical protein